MNGRLDYLNRRIKALTEHIGELADERELLRIELATLTCPFDIGDTMIPLDPQGARIKRARLVGIHPPQYVRAGSSTYRLELKGIKTKGYKLYETSFFTDDASTANWIREPNGK